MRRSEKIKSKQFKMEGEGVPDRGNKDNLPNVREDVSQTVTPANDAASASAGKKGNKKGGSSSRNPSRNIPARDKALQTSVILRNIFQFCPAPIVAACRLVCKQWHDETLVTYRNAFPPTIKIKDGKLFVARTRKCSCHHFRPPPICICTPLKEFLEFNQTSAKPYRNITLEGCEFSLNPFDFDLFWKDIGSNLTTLKLYRCYFTNIDELRQVLYKCCPLLQNLNLQHCGFPERAAGEKEEDGHEYKQPLFGEHKHLKSLWMNRSLLFSVDEFPLSWLELFSHYPSLTSLEISCGHEYEDGFPDPEFEALTTAVRNVRKIGKHKLPLKRFSFTPLLTISPDSASQRRFALVKELRLPLTKFKIKVHPKLNQRFVTSTLGHLASSVNSITMHRRKAENEEEDEDSVGEQLEVPTWLRNFPFGFHLKKLTSLSADEDYFGSFTFLKYTPNLASLRISECENFGRRVVQYATTTEAISNICKTELTGVKMLQLTEFKLGFIIRNNDMQHLVSWMPNITVLAMVLNDKQFGMVCQNWKNVRKLEELGNRLTGIMYQQEGKKATRAGSRPNITNLQGLKILHVKGVELSKKDVFDLFLHMPNLDYLTYQKGAVSRENLDLSSYQRAIQDNQVTQWISNLGNRRGR